MSWLPRKQRPPVVPVRSGPSWKEKAGGDVAKARQAALKAGLNKHTVYRQMWLISKGE